MKRRLCILRTWIPSSRNSSDSAALYFALGTAAIMIAQQVAGKATRDALFLSHFAATDLPKVMLASAVLSIGGVLSISRILTHRGPARIVPVAFGLSASLFITEWLLVAISPALAAVVLYLHMGVFGAILISSFWAVINERFDPHSAKRAVGQIAAAATFGGVIGGIITERMASLVGVHAMLLVLGGMHILCMIGVTKIGPSKQSSSKAAESSFTLGFQVLSKSRYLQLMAALVILVAVVSTLLDYVLKATVAAQYSGGEDLIQFFALFYTITGVATFLLQTSLGPLSLQKLGIGATVGVLPAAVMSGSLLGLFLTQVWVVAVLRGGESVLANSFFRSGFELLYIPLPSDQKRSTKAIIDVAGDRLGDVIASGIILALLFFIPHLPPKVVIGCVLGGAVSILFLVVRLHREYIAQLAEGLRAGIVQFQEDEVLDVTTYRTLTETNLTIDREQLLAKIAQFQQVQERLVQPSASADPRDARIQGSTVPLEHAPLGPDSLLHKVNALLSGQPESIQAVLRRDAPIDPKLVPLLIPLLNQPQLALEVKQALSAIAPRVVGQLTDSLLDSSQPTRLRCHLAALLASCGTPRARDGLLLGVGDSLFAVRYSCGQSLAHLQADYPRLPIVKTGIHDAIQQELSIRPWVWARQVPMDTDQEAAAGKGYYSRKHIFTLLSLVLDRELIQLSFRALESRNATVRGLALEYLENVLPDAVRDRMWNRIGTPPPDRFKRPTQEVEDELLQSFDAVSTDREEWLKN